MPNGHDIASFVTSFDASFHTFTRCNDYYNATFYVIEHRALPNRDLPQQRTPKPWFTTPKHSQTVIYRTKVLPNRDLLHQGTAKPWITAPKHPQTMIYLTKALLNHELLHQSTFKPVIYRIEVLPCREFPHQSTPNAWITVPNRHLPKYYKPRFAAQKFTQTVIYRTKAFPPWFTIPKRSKTVIYRAKALPNRVYRTKMRPIRDSSFQNQDITTQKCTQTALFNGYVLR